MIKFLCISLLGLITCSSLKAQKVDSIYFHLYTDSLKKGTHNYINVDGKLSNGQWMPMTSKDISFSSSACKFSGNELIVPADFSADKITVKAVLKTNTDVWIERTIWIKKKPDGDLPTQEEVLREFRKKPGRKKRN
ncbi:MAG: hypothetical protein ACXWV8_13255 [Chitinophagaceae bacterium]